ncbi:MAG: hypothetical protein ACRDRL_21965 [Sciscionella sp.]
MRQRFAEFGVRPASELAAATAAATETTARGRILPVLPDLACRLPFGGLRRGSTVAVRGSTALLLSLLATATTEGSWAGCVGLPDLGVLRAAELGVCVSRLALVPDPGTAVTGTLAALLDGIDLVAVSSRIALGSGDRGAVLAHRLSARARNRGAVLLAFGAWPGADVELKCRATTWTGLESGAGGLRECRMWIGVEGRGIPPASRRFSMTLSRAARPDSIGPDATGRDDHQDSGGMPRPMAAVG